LKGEGTDRGERNQDAKLEESVGQREGAKTGEKTEARRPDPIDENWHSLEDREPSAKRKIHRSWDGRRLF